MIDTSTLIQVEDSNGVWHAAHIGRGVLCSVARLTPDEQGRVTALVDTVSWTFGLDQISCPTCQDAVRTLEVAA